MQLSEQEKIFQKYHIDPHNLKDAKKVYQHVMMIEKSQNLIKKFERYLNLDPLVKISVKDFLEDHFKKLNYLFGKKECRLAEDIFLYLDSIAKYYNMKKYQTLTVEELQKDQAAAALVGNVKLVNYLINKEITLRKINKQEYSLFGNMCNFFFPPQPTHAYLSELLAGVALSGDMELFKRIADVYRYQIGKLCLKNRQMIVYILAYAFRSENIGMIDSVKDALALDDEYVKTSLGALLVASAVIENETILNHYDIAPYKGRQDTANSFRPSPT